MGPQIIIVWSTFLDWYINSASIKINRETDNTINNYIDVLDKLENPDNDMWESLLKLANHFNSFITDSAVEFLYDHFNHNKEKVASIVKAMVENSSDWAFAYETEFDKLIVMIGQDKVTRDAFYSINVCLTNRGIYRFKDVVSE